MRRQQYGRPVRQRHNMATPWCARRHRVDADRMQAHYQRKIVDMPPGVLGIPTSHLGRYRDFEVCFTSLSLPPGSFTAWGQGSNPTKNMNDFIRQLLKVKEMEWLWIIGDDHVFPPDIIIRLYERGKDIVVPLCTRRTYPYIPTVHNNGHDSKDYNNWRSVEYEWFRGKSGLVNLNKSDKIVGNAGMLIKKSVFEKMEGPWFEVGKVDSEYPSPDLWFAKKAVDAGFNLWLDMDNPIGHLTHMGAWPFFDVEKNEWGAEIRSPNDAWGERGLMVD